MRYVLLVCREVEGESEGHVSSEGRLTAVGNERCYCPDGNADVRRTWRYWLYGCRLSCADHVSAH